MQTQKGDLSSEKLRLTKLQADKAEIELKILMNEIVYKDDEEAKWLELAGAFKTRLDAIPTNIAPMLALENDISVIEAVIKKELSEALDELYRTTKRGITRKNSRNDRKGASFFEAERTS